MRVIRVLKVGSLNGCSGAGLLNAGTDLGALSVTCPAHQSCAMAAVLVTRHAMPRGMQVCFTAFRAYFMFIFIDSAGCSAEVYRMPTALSLPFFVKQGVKRGVFQTLM